MQHKLAQPTDVGPMTVAPDTTEKVQQFVDALYALARTVHICMRCGSAMQFADATFSLWNGDRSWNIPLPFCRYCDFETLQLPRSNAA